MATTTKKPSAWWKSLIKVLIILITSIGSSQVATTNPVIDSAVKTAITTASNIVVDALSSDTKDTVIIVTEKENAKIIEANKD